MCSPCGDCCSSYDAISDYETIHSCLANETIPVTKYTSKSSGLTVVHAEIEGPIITGYICVPTRATNDEGLPHALEHLVFYGSKSYPYVGVLDTLANKCLASSTNAWTDVDHTCFTLSTVGIDGFCQLLPIYMDHILFPLLTDAAFRTEVYHVGGRGNDGGIIYSEIQTLENTSYSKASEVLFKELYPPDSGYRWNVGGSLKSLRESTTNDKVKAFHNMFYHTGNICIIICGKIGITRVFRCLHPAVRKASQDIGDESKIIRPWLTRESSIIPDVAVQVQKSVTFPSAAEDMGCLLTVGVLGPSVLSEELKETYAFTLLFKYLTKSANAPLQQEFVEKQTGYMATKVDFNAVEYSRTAFLFELDGLALQEKSQSINLLRKTLEAQVKKFDKARMDEIIKASILAELTLLENSPQGTIADAIIRDYIYGNNDYSKFKQRLNRTACFKMLLYETTKFWTNLIKEKLLKSKWVIVCAEPSQKLLHEQNLEDDARVTLRRDVLGENGMSIFMHELDAAILYNSRPIPEKILKQIKVPSIKSLQFHHINRIKNPTWMSRTDFPTTLCIDDISTNFVYLGLLMDTSNLNDQYRKFLPLFKEALLTSPCRGALNATKSKYDLIPFEAVEAMRNRDLQVCELAFGIEMDFRGEGATVFSCGSYSHVLALDFQMEMYNVQQGIQWVRKIFWETEWSLDSIKISIIRLIEEANQLMQDGSKVCQMVLKHLIYKENSNVVNCGVIEQLKLLEELGADNDSKVAENEQLIKTAFDAILKVVTNPENISLHIAAPLNKLRGTLETLECGSLGALLKKSFPFPKGSGRQKESSDFPNLPDTTWMIPLEKVDTSKGDKYPAESFKNQVICGHGQEDTSYLGMVAPGPSSYSDKDVPALLTTLQYFTQTEGPLYKKIRGESLAYSYNAVTKVNEGIIYFHLYRCHDLVQAYSACLSVIVQHLNTKSNKVWKQDLLVAAKSSLIFQCLDTEKTPLSLAANSMLDYFRMVGGDYMRQLTAKISKVTLKDVKKMTRKYLEVLFNCPKNNIATVVVCPEERALCVQKGMEEIGKAMRIINSFDDL